MNLLATLIIEMFKKYLESVAILSDRGFTYKEVMKRSFSLADRLQVMFPNKTRIALIAENSAEWIIIFLAIILSNHKLVLISPRLSKNKLRHAVLDSRATLLITDKKIDDIESNYPLVASMMYIDDIDFTSDTEVTNLSMIDEEDGLIIYTPRHLTRVKISYKEVVGMLGILDKKKIFDECLVYTAYQEFTYNYVLTVLLPLLNGTTIKTVDYFSVHQDFDDEVIILNGYQFEEIWREHIDPLTDPIMKFLGDFNFRRIKNWRIKVNLKKIFPNVKKLIILNSSINLQIETILKKVKFPYTVTYGTVETCGIASYSDPSEFIKGSCGKEIYYLSSEEYTSDDSLLISSDDIVYFENRKEEVIKTEYGFTITRDVERILKNLPLVIDCVLVNFNDKLILMVYVNVEYIDSENMKMDKVNQILNNCITRINNEVHTFEKISDITITLNDFKRDSYGRILREFYTIQ